MHPTSTCKHHLGNKIVLFCIWVQPKRQYLDKLIFQACPPQTGHRSVAMGLSWAVRGWGSSHGFALFRWVAKASTAKGGAWIASLFCGALLGLLHSAWTMAGHGLKRGWTVLTAPHMGVGVQSSDPCHTEYYTTLLSRTDRHIPSCLLYSFYLLLLIQ